VSAVDRGCPRSWRPVSHLERRREGKEKKRKKEKRREKEPCLDGFGAGAPFMGEVGVRDGGLKRQMLEATWRKKKEKKGKKRKKKEKKKKEKKKHL
jgi:hypothetical protein